SPLFTAKQTAQTAKPILVKDESTHQLLFRLHKLGGYAKRGLGQHFNFEGDPKGQRTLVLELNN
ncbi:MAG: hypothetical protein ACI9IP_002859, partial [Arcticibacterium sp.]